ncbi:collagen alpha-1(XII) chain-like, partial [Argonauta hians]
GRFILFINNRKSLIVQKPNIFWFSRQKMRKKRMVQFNILLLIMLYINKSTGLFFRTGPVNCVVTEWSEWSKPRSFGLVERHRKILRPAESGGTPCPPTAEKLTVREHPTVNQTAEHFAHKFVTNRRRLTYTKTFIDPIERILPRDLLIIMDSSGSVSPAEFQQSKDAMAEVIKLICGDVGQSFQDNRIAAMHFSDFVYEDFPFNKSFLEEEVAYNIRQMPKHSGSTCTGDAFNYARVVMLKPEKGMRPDSQSIKDVLILTDGHSNCGSKVKIAAEKLKKVANVYALAIGMWQKQRDEIRSYASSPAEDHLFSLKYFSDLPDFMEGVRAYSQQVYCVPFFGQSQ